MPVLGCVIMAIVYVEEDGDNSEQLRVRENTEMLQSRTWRVIKRF